MERRVRLKYFATEFKNNLKIIICCMLIGALAAGVLYYNGYDSNKDNIKYSSYIILNMEKQATEKNTINTNIDLSNVNKAKLKSDDLLKTTIRKSEEKNLHINVEELRNSLILETQGNGSIVKVSILDKDKENANTLCEIYSETVMDGIAGYDVYLLQEATTQGLVEPSSGSIRSVSEKAFTFNIVYLVVYCILGAIVGAVGAYGVVIVLFILLDRLNYVEQINDHMEDIIVVKHICRAKGKEDKASILRLINYTRFKDSKNTRLVFIVCSKGNSAKKFIVDFAKDVAEEIENKILVGQLNGNTGCKPFILNDKENDSVVYAELSRTLTINSDSFNKQLTEWEDVYNRIIFYNDLSNFDLMPKTLGENAHIILIVEKGKTSIEEFCAKEKLLERMGHKAEIALLVE